MLQVEQEMVLRRSMVHHSLETVAAALNLVVLVLLSSNGRKINKQLWQL
jgi:hypothetical protein